jgi:heat shock protein HslJ
MLKKILIQTIIVLAFLTLVACSSGADAGEDLIGPVWVATSMNGHNLVPTTTISAEFNAEDSVSGSTGCNTYSTSYTVDGNNITFGDEMAVTRAFCAEPVNEQESEYLLMLNEADRFEINDDELTLLDSDDNSLVVYLVQSQALEGSSWYVISYNNGRGGVTSVIIGTEMTANFAEGGQLSGSSGCNNYTAAYENEGETISIGPPGLTRQFCAEPEGVMEQESEYLAALQTAATYRIEGNSMNMRTADGETVANFSRTSGQ